MAKGPISEIRKPERRVKITPVFQWTEWLFCRGFNWINCDLININAEYERYSGGLVVCFIILGVGFHADVVVSRSARDELLGSINSARGNIEGGGG